MESDVDLFATPAFEMETPFRVTDLKQWVYCPRVLYFHTVLKDIRPTTYKMEAGVEAGDQQEKREARQELRGSLRRYGLESGRREFNVPVASARLGLRGAVDMVIWSGINQEQIIPVDFKLSRVAGEHFKLQLAAYAMLLEETYGGEAKRGFLYMIPLRRVEAVQINKRLREKLLATLDAMHRMLGLETMPSPTKQRGKCVACEFRRFLSTAICADHIAG